MLASLAGGIFTGVLCGMFFGKGQEDKQKREQIPDSQEQNTRVSKLVIPEPNFRYRKGLKVVVGIRTDMKLNLPEMASCLSDIVIKTVVNSVINKSPYIGSWIHQGQTKVCTKVQNQQMMDSLIQKAEENNVIHETLEYKGQIAAFVAGPAPIEQVDLVTSHLKLL